MRADLLHQSQPSSLESFSSMKSCSQQVARLASGDVSVDGPAVVTLCHRRPGQPVNMLEAGKADGCVMRAVLMAALVGTQFPCRVQKCCIKMAIGYIRKPAQIVTDCASL